MKEIIKSNTAVSALIGNFKNKANQYREMYHLVKQKVEDGMLIYNSLTGAMFLLDKEETKMFESNSPSPDFLGELLKHYIFVPYNYNESLTSDQINSFMRMYISQRRDNIINKFTVFTTTDCNARCFYCFENGRKYITMSEQTAMDVAKFMEKSAKGTDISISWFGGEPLYNEKVINIICQYLFDKGLNYESTMVSNGYLFSAENIKTAKEKWHLKHVKIAVDGTEKIYNKYKNFIYKDGSAYLRVMNNIKMLLENNIAVTIRLNMDTHNYEDLFVLRDELFERFGTNDLLTYDLHMLLENSTSVQKNRSDKERHEIVKKYHSLQSHYAEKFKTKKFKLSDVRRWTQCKADDDRATTILPDGNLGKCEYYTTEGFWGNIYSSEVNYNEIQRFKEMMRPNGGEKCDKCPVRPICMQLKVCADTVDRCDEYDQSQKIDLIKNVMLREYAEYKNK